MIWNHHYKNIDINQPSSLAQLDKILRDQSNKIKDDTLKKYTKEFFLNKLSQLTPLTNKQQRINFKAYRETKPLNLTKEIFSKKKNYKEVEFKPPIEEPKYPKDTNELYYNDEILPLINEQSIL